MKKKRKNFLGVVGQEMTEADSKGPDDSHQWPRLRSIPCPLGEESRNKDIGRCQERKNEEIFPFPPQEFGHAQKGKKVDWRIKKEAVPLVQKVTSQRFPFVAERDVDEDFFQKSQGLREAHGSLPGNRGKGKGAIKGILEVEIGARQEGRKRKEIEPWCLGSRFFPDDREAIKEKRYQEKKVF